MAEGFEPYHIPQQSRRDKLRVAGGEPPSAPFLPYDHSSLMPSDLLACTAAANHHALLAGGDKVKDEAVVCRSLVPPSSSVGNHHHLYGMDPPAVAVNPTCSTAIHDLASGGAFLYAPQTLQNLRDLAHSYNSTLSLSLSSHDNASDNNRPVSDNLSLPLELNLQRYGSAASNTGCYLTPTAISIGVGRGLASATASTSAVPLGPFTGYSLILKGSRFLRPAHQLLEELCDVGCSRAVEKIAEVVPSLAVDPSELDSVLNIEESSSSPSSSGADVADVRRKKSRLISMLDEVCQRYKQYFQQIQDVVAAFEYVAGFGNAAPYANLALKAMSKHFRSLKSVITDQLHLNKEQVNPRRDEGYPSFGNKDANPYGQRAITSSGFFDHHQPVWRPQRGLPDRAVTVLRAWLFEHFLHPYPTDTDKIMLAKQTGLSRSQVSNWFINARVRLWKPMVEEIHMLETQQAQKASNLPREDHNNADTNSSRPVDHHLLLASETPSISMPRVHESLPNKRTRNDVPEFPVRNDGDRSHHLSYDPRDHNQHVSVGDQGISSSLNNSVSLTLGLHQNNNRIGLPEAYQVNVAQRFATGLEGNSEGFVLSGYEGQDRQFGRDVYGGQLLHDFVG